MNMSRMASWGMATGRPVGEGEDAPAEDGMALAMVLMMCLKGH